MAHGSWKLTAVTIIAVLLTLTLVWWRLTSGTETTAGNDWQTNDTERLRMDLETWLTWLRKLPPAQKSEALTRRLDDSVRHAERPALVRQTLLMLDGVQHSSPIEVARYRGSDIVRATWSRRDGSKVSLNFRCTSGDTPKLLRTTM